MQCNCRGRYIYGESFGRGSWNKHCRVRWLGKHIPNQPCQTRPSDPLLQPGVNLFYVQYHPGSPRFNTRYFLKGPGLRALQFYSAFRAVILGLSGTSCLPLLGSSNGRQQQSAYVGYGLGIGIRDSCHRHSGWCLPLSNNPMIEPHSFLPSLSLQIERLNVLNEVSPWIWLWSHLGLGFRSSEAAEKFDSRLGHKKTH